MGRKVKRLVPGLRIAIEAGPLDPTADGGVTLTAVFGVEFGAFLGDAGAGSTCLAATALRRFLAALFGLGLGLLGLDRKSVV